MPDFTSRFFEAPDGLRLHARDYGRAEADAPTVLCLPGLARTTADFDALARHLVATDPARRVLALDYRGRGLSARDPDPANYDIPVELADILAVLDALGVAEAVLVGTSRGGLHTMILSAVRPTLIRGAVLNDIGPVVEASGLARIRGYVGKLRQPASWEDAVAILRDIAATQFTGLSDADWLAYAQATFEEDGGVFRPLYDPALMNNLAKLDLNAVPTLWPQFEALGRVPVLVIRGENSELLSPVTAAAMTARLPDCTLLTVPGQGHAPLLTDMPTMMAIERFVVRCFSEPVATSRMADGLALLQEG